MVLEVEPMSTTLKASALLAVLPLGFSPTFRSQPILLPQTLLASLRIIASRASIFSREVSTYQFIPVAL